MFSGGGEDLPLDDSKVEYDRLPQVLLEEQLVAAKQQHEDLRKMISTCQKDIVKCEREGNLLDADIFRKHMNELFEANRLMKDKIAKIKKAQQ